MEQALFEELKESIRQAALIRAGQLRPGRVTVVVGPDTEVAQLRASYGLSQSKFAKLLGISVDTLQNWEQGRRTPDGPARVLLRIAEQNPAALIAANCAPSSRGKSAIAKRMRSAKK